MTASGCGAARCLLVQDWSAFEAWAGAWSRLLAAAPEATLFHDPAWLRQAWRYPGEPVTAVLLCRGGELDAGLILCPRWETGFNVALPVRALHCLPHLPLLDPCAAVVAKRPAVGSEAIADALACALPQLAWDVLLIGRLVPRLGWLEDAVTLLARREGWRTERVAEAPEAVVDLSHGSETYWAGRSKDLVRRIRGGRRRLAASGAFVLQDAAAEDLQWARVRAAIEAVFDGTWQRQGGLSPFGPVWREHTFTAFAELYAEGCLFPFFAWLDGGPVAFEVWYGARGECYGLARGMLPDYGKHSLGNVLAAYVVDRAAARGFRRQWLGTLNDLPHFAYKRRWLTELEGGRQLLVTRPRSWYGRLHGLLRGSRVAAAVWQRLRMKPLALGLFNRLRDCKRGAGVLRRRR